MTEEPIKLLSTRIDIMDARMEAMAITIAATQTQILSHVAVCDERQRQMELRSSERRRWEDDQAREMRTFMDESRADRQRIKDSVQVNAWRILLLVTTAIVLNFVGSFLFNKSGIFHGL